MTTDKLAAGIIKWRWAIIVATFVIVGIIASGLTNISFSSNYRVFFSSDNEQLVAFETIQNTYSKSDNVLLVVEPEDGIVFSRETLSAIQELTESSWQLPYSTRVDSITNYQHTQAEEDDLIVADLVEFPEDVDLDYVKNVALNEPLLVRRLISPEAHVTAVNVTIQLPELSESETREVVSAARNIVADFEEKYPNLSVYITGTTMLGNAFAEASEADMKSLMPIMLCVIIVTLWLLLRSFTGTVATILVIILSALTAMGLFGHLGWVLTGPTTSAPVIITTMAVADSVHILVTFLYNLRQGMPKHSAMQESIRINFQPVFITSLTTVLGFMTMNFSEVPPFRDLGNTVAMGVIAALFFSVFFLPAFMSVMPISTKKQAARQSKGMDKLASFIINNRNGVLIGSGIVTVVLFALIPLNQINDDFIAYFKESVEFRADTEFTSDNLTGIYNIAFSLEQGESNGISQPEFLRQVESFSQWLKSKPEVTNVETITEIFKRLNKNMHADNQDFFMLPEDKELAAQYLLLYEMSLPYGLDLNNQLNIDKSSARILISLENVDTRTTLRLEQEISQWLEDNTDIESFYAASTNLMFSHIGKRNVDSMIMGVCYALIVIIIVMCIVLRSLRLGAVSIIPNLVPIGATFGIWGLFQGDVGISIGSGVGMILGIVIDNTVHFLSKYQRARREKNYTAEEAVRYAFTMVGTALWVTTFVLVAGFMVLALSDFNMNAYMGIFTAITITLALIFDFFALPAMLLWLDKGDKSHTTSMQNKEAVNDAVTVNQQAS
ncbi:MULTISPECIES: RND family transporter [unclassified Oleiphilus]|nr:MULTISPECIES: MMPL family transporter [unclassified Oleiphilus]